MKKIVQIIAILTILTLSSWAKEGQIIVNIAVTQALTEADIKSIYLGKKTQWHDETEIAPAYQSNIDLVGVLFFEKIIKKKHKYFKKYWIKKVFSGNGVAPKILNKDEDVIDYVASNPGGIGFVNINMPLNKSVKALDIKW
jgi:ABC-type phosphate transport system substrate-binding protein